MPPTETAAAVAPAEDQASPQATPASRIVGYDLARAVAIGGMVLVHFALVMGGKDATPGWPGWVLHALDGRATALFVILAGVGITLRASRAAATPAVRASAPSPVLVRRGLFLLAAGFVNLTIWPGDILRIYGISLMLAAFLLGASDRALLVLAGAFVLGFIGLFAAFEYDTHWDWAALHYKGLWTPAGVIRNLFYDGFRSVFPWTGLLLFGMWLGRRDVGRAGTRPRLLAWGLAVAATAEVVSAVAVRAWLARPDHPGREIVRALVGTDSMPPLPLFLVAAGGAAVAVMAMCLMLAAVRPAALPIRALVATGQMAFTWYVAHILLGLGFVVAMGWDKAGSPRAGLAAGSVFFVLAIVISVIWKRFARHGPLEWLLRKIAD